MDDKDFDKYVKHKIGDYQHPDFDEDAFASFKNRMSAEAQSPWFRTYRNELITAAAISLIALIFLWLQSEMNKNTVQKLSGQLTQLQEQNDKLQLAMSSLDQAPDTIYVVESAESETNDVLARQVILLQQQLRNSRAADAAPVNTEKQLVYAGTSETLPEETLRFLDNNHQLVRNGDYYFILIDKNLPENEALPYLERNNGFTRHYTLTEYEFVRERLDGKPDLNTVVITQSREARLPAKLIRSIEDEKYVKGIGIELGPAAEIYRAMYSPGRGGAAYGVGLLANFITSPRLSIETGALLNMSEYEFDPGEVSRVNIPPPDPAYGNFTGMEVNAQFIEIPLNLKYRHRISASTHLVGGIGLSSFLYTKQEFEYQYSFDTSEGLSLPVEKPLPRNNPAWMSGTFNLSLGISTRLNNGKRIETQVFYKPGISPVGNEDISIQYLGIRASYMFDIK